MSDLLEEIWAMPSIDSHEHIGSMRSAGASLGYWSFAPDLRPGHELNPTTIFDLILSPCFEGLLHSVGFTPPIALAPYYGPASERPGSPRRLPYFHELSATDQDRLWESLGPCLARTRGTGFYVAHDAALRDLYGTSLDALMEGRTSWREVSAMVTERYQRGLFQWTQTMFARGNIRYALKPVHLPYLARMGEEGSNPSYVLERQLLAPILRVDDLMGYAEAGALCSWRQAEEALGIGIRAVADLEEMVERSFGLLAAYRIKAIKQAQAYTRSIEFGPATREDAESALTRLARDQDPAAALVVQDYLMELISAKAAAAGLPHQVHTGVFNLPHGNPVLLRGVVERHGAADFVLLHCYPYLSESAFMAWQYRNVYLDATWMALLSPGVLYQALREWIGVVPYSKICLSGDGCSVEEAYGAMHTTRNVLARILGEKVAAGELNLELAREVAEALLWRNSARLYGESAVDECG